MKIQQGRFQPGLQATIQCKNKLVLLTHRASIPTHKNTTLEVIKPAPPHNQGGGWIRKRLLMGPKKSLFLNIPVHACECVEAFHKTYILISNMNQNWLFI